MLGSGLPVAYLWPTCGLPVAYLWPTCGLPVAYLWPTWAYLGLPVAYLWPTWAYLWPTCGLPVAYLGLPGPTWAYLWPTCGLPVAYLWPTYAGKVGHSVTRVKTAQKWTSGLVGLPFTAKVYVRVCHHYRSLVLPFFEICCRKGRPTRPTRPV